MGPDIWSPIIDHLPGTSIQRADLGFRGTPAKPEVQAPLVIAHSLGLMWALNHLPRPWSGVIILAGFTRFSRTESFPGVEPRLLARMKSRLEVDPSGAVTEFLYRCGIQSPNTNALDVPRLSQGLDWLMDWDERNEFARLDCPTLSIVGSADPIVTQEHSRACFAGIPQITVDGAGHLLPQTHAGWIANRLKAALKGDWSA